jgi:HSP20 family protein
VRYRHVGSRLGYAEGRGGSIVWRTQTIVLQPVAWQPAADVCESEGSIGVMVDLAGVGDEEVEISVYPDALVVEGSRGSMTCPGGGVFHRAEIRSGPFRLVLPLPGPVESERVTAHFERGLLLLELPKAGRAAERGSAGRHAS